MVSFHKSGHTYFVNKVYLVMIICGYLGLDIVDVYKRYDYTFETYKFVPFIISKRKSLSAQ